MPLTFRRNHTLAIVLPAALVVAVAPLARAQQNSADNGKEELPPK